MQGCAWPKGPSRPGPGVGTSPWGQYKTPGMPLSIRALFCRVFIHLISLSFDSLRLTQCSLPGSLSKTRPLSQPKQRLQSSCRDFSFVNCCYVSQTTHIRIGLSARLTCPPHTDRHYNRLLQVWSLTQFYSVDFSKSRIDVNKCVSYKRTIKVCVSCC